MDTALQKSGPVFNAQGVALKVWGCRDREVLFVGPARTGKSRMLLERANYQAMRYSKCRILLVRKTRNSMSESVLQTYEDQVIPAKSTLLNGSKRSIRQDYIYPNSSRIIVRGMDNPEAVLSSEYDAIYCFESLELTQNDYELLMSRLSGEAMPYQQLVMDCNPGSPTHWIRRKMLKGEFTIFESQHTDNPRWYNPTTGEYTKQGKAYLGSLKRILTGVRYDRLYLGKWAQAEGVIYEIGEKNLIDASDLPNGKIPKDWRRIRVVDFGYTAPFVCQWWAIDPDGRMYMYREIYMTRKLVREMAQLIVLLSVGENIEATVADWDAEGRADLEQHGVPTIQAHKAWEPGRDAVQARLRVEGDGKPRIMFLRDALVERDDALVELMHPIQTTEEFDLYVYKKATRSIGDGGEYKIEKEEPIDKYDHGMDAMRYMVAYVDGIGRMMADVTTDTAVVVPQPNYYGPPQKSGQESGLVFASADVAIGGTGIKDDEFVVWNR